MNEKLKYLGKNTILFAISSFGTKFLSFFLVPLYTNILSTSEYGTADIISTTATLLVYLLTLDIADGVTRFTIEIGDNSSKPINGELNNTSVIKKQQEDILSYANRVIAIACLICSCGLAVVYLTHLLKWKGYYYIFILLFFFSSAFYQMISNYLRGIDKVGAVAVAGVVSSLVTIIFNILFLVIIRLGIIGYLLSSVLGPLAASFYCIIKTNAPLKVFFINSCPHGVRKEMMEYCIPLVFNNIALWINAYLDRYFITAIIGVDQNGIYAVAGKIPNILAMCCSVFGQAWGLSAVKEFDPEDKDGFFRKTYSVYNAFMVIVCSGIILFNIPLARFLYAKDFFAAWKCSSILLISTFFNTLTVYIGAVFSAVKKTKILATTTLISAAVNTVMNIILIPSFGSVGAAIATAMALFTMWAIRMSVMKKYIQFKVNIFLNCFSYFLMCLQVIFEHTKSHFYVGQLACLVTILILYNREIRLILNKFIKNIQKK